MGNETHLGAGGRRWWGVRGGPLTVWGTPCCVGHPSFSGRQRAKGCRAPAAPMGCGGVMGFCPCSPYPQKPQTFPRSPVWPSSPVPLAEWFAHVTWKWAVMRGKRWWCWKGVCVCVKGGRGGELVSLAPSAGRQVSLPCQKERGGKKNKIMKSKHGHERTARQSPTSPCTQMVPTSRRG